jgi:hypothetical protein
VHSQYRVFVLRGCVYVCRVLYLWRERPSGVSTVCEVFWSASGRGDSMMACCNKNQLI